MLQRFIYYVKRRETPFARFFYAFAVWLRQQAVPDALLPLYRLLYAERSLRIACWRRFVSLVYYQPMFRARCQRVGRRLQYVVLAQKLPYFSGDIRVVLGDDCIVHSRATFAAGHVHARPLLEVGEGSYLGPGLSIGVAERIRIGRHCHIASNVSIHDNDAHPLDPAARAAHLPVGKSGVRPVTIGDHVWIGEAAMILKGVHIGDCAVVGAGSVVTADVEAWTVVAGNPARPLRRLDEYRRERG